MYYNLDLIASDLITSHQIDSLERSALASRMRLQTEPAYIEPQLIHAQEIVVWLTHWILIYTCT